MHKGKLTNVNPPRITTEPFKFKKREKIQEKTIRKDGLLGDRDRIQTCNRLIRSQLLYSVELRDRYFVLTGAKIRTFPELASFSPTFFVENYSMNR